MEKLKQILRPIYLPLINYKASKLYKQYSLIKNFIVDYKLYKNYSIVFSKQDLLNKEADLILNYHSIEKGMLFKDTKKGFATNRIKNLHKLLNDPEIIKNINRSQIKVGYQVICKYYEMHKNEGYNIEHIFSQKQYEKYKSVLKTEYSDDFNGVINWDKEKFYEFTSQDFFKFAYSRKSVREFTGELIQIDLIQKAITLANTAPSVCNRQASNVYLIEDKKKIDEILNIQGGFTGYTKNVNQLLILTNDRKFYYTVGERNQFYIDGGIYLMNLLYALHYYKIGNCPANWGKKIDEEKKLDKVISIPESEKIICLIPIGELKDKFRTTLSKRRPITENFQKL
ncbi:nitroreductase family protein [Faecalibacter bovis]|uniref:Nitroreductase family protein n=1 Tax=Faecalibacter bovis TaxID=2898187 RepID=A0ABX7XFC4_9FLAO|nr:nitroreductase family protein [Faecalibacter bovis]QTV06633.1 nitroreductase family protein [Faecalibacter bovis]